MPEDLVCLVRVTKMGEFPPFECLFTLVCLKKYLNSTIFWISLFRGKSLALILKKNVLGYILGDFFHKLIWSPWPSSAQMTQNSLKFRKSQSFGRIFGIGFT
jgi:hypothetical protein